MAKDSVSRRSLLTVAGSVGIAGRLPEPALAFQARGQVIHEVAAGPTHEHTPGHTIKFAVIGLDHNHINGITDTIRRGGGELVSVHSTNPGALAGFQKRYSGVKVARSEDEILNDSSIQLVCSAAIPDLRAPLGVRVMRHGKDFLSDKPAITTLEQLAEVRRTVKETGRIFGIMYGRMESRATMHAGALVKEGAIGRVVQTLQLAPHRVNENARPEWFWDPLRYGGTLCDLGSHQARRVRLLHRVHRGRGNDVAGGESELPPSSEIPGLRGHDSAWQWRPWIFSRGLVHPGWHGGVWRRTDLHSGNGGVYRTTEDHRHRRTAGWGSPV